MRRLGVLLVFITFLALTGVAVWRHGYVGLFRYQLATWAGAQVLADLVIALCFALTWIWRDAKKNGRAFWPWVVATCFLGSLAPLAYLLTGKPKGPPQ